MNIFFLSLDPKEAASFYCDKHAIKIILEIAQLLWCAFHLTGEEGWEESVPPNVKIYKKTHVNHPMSIWVRNSIHNYRWTVQHGLELCEEYKLRYGNRKGRQHACQGMLEWMRDNEPRCDSKDVSTTAVYAETAPEGCTPIPMCMPIEYHNSDIVTAYRRYYVEDKLKIADWKFTPQPAWVSEMVVLDDLEEEDVQSSST